MADEEELKSPLTSQQLEKWVGEVEDKAWAAQTDTSACRFLLGNLLGELQDMGLLDAGAFITKLRSALPPDMDSAQTRIGIADLLDDLQLFFFTSSPRATWAKAVQAVCSIRVNADKLCGAWPVELARIGTVCGLVF